jgi:hypothetical protein
MSTYDLVHDCRPGPVVTGNGSLTGSRSDELARDQAFFDIAWDAVARLTGAQSAGAMLELKRKTLDGSYSRLSAASRAYVRSP